MQAQYNTTIKDAEGIDHEYMTVSYPSSEGMDLILTIGQILGGPIGYFIETIFSLGVEDDNAETDIDLSQLPQMIEKIPNMLLEKGGYRLFMRILSKTKRCREGDAWDALKEQRFFDAIYASNYIELFEAIGWVLKVNFAPFSQDGTRNWKGLWEKLQSFIPISPNMNPTTKSARDSLRTIGDIKANVGRC